MNRQNICRVLLYHWLIQLSNSAALTCWEKSKRREETDRRRKRDKRGRLQECRGAPSDGVMRRTKRRRGNRLVTFNDVFSVEASLCLCPATGGREVHVRAVNAHSCTYTHKLSHTTNWRRSLNMPNKSLHNKVPTHHWREVHPLNTPQCAHSYRINGAVCLSSGQTQLITSVLPAASQLAQR